MTGTLPIGKGGTGATSAATARTSLGLGAAAVKEVDNTISSTSTNIPTTAAVINYVETHTSSGSSDITVDQNILVVEDGDGEGGIQTDTTLSVAGIAADAKATGDAIFEIKDDLNEAIEEFAVSTQEAVDNWLTEHPEATTTVQDGSLTYKKLVTGTLGFVTPEMFGAVGDGVTDDTEAMQNAVSSDKPIRLINDYYCGKVSGTNIIIIGDGHKIINKTNDVMFYASGNFIGENFTIQNQEIYDYSASVTPYGSISALNIYCVNVNFVNVNCSAFYVTGDCIIDSCNIDNGSFDIKTIYDGSSNNRIYGVYVHQTEYTNIISVTNCKLSYLIEGVYFGSYVDGQVKIKIDNNYFHYIGDHCAYINSYEDRAHAVISNNFCHKVTVAFATSGNNHLIVGNLVYGVYDGDRVCFGFSIRDGSNVTYRDNIFISGEFTTSQGINASCLITSLITSTKRDNILFENNYFDFNDSSVNVYWLRLGHGNGAELGKVIFKNNYMSIKGGTYAVTANVNVDFVMENNVLFFNQKFLQVQTGTAYIINNKIENVQNANVFSEVSKGHYKHNKFNCITLPLRRATDTLFDVEGNTNAYGNGVYNLINTGTTDLKHKCLKKGTFTANASGANILDADDIRPSFHNKLLVFDDLGNEVSFTVSNVRTSYIDITEIAAGTYYYILM